MGSVEDICGVCVWCGVYMYMWNVCVVWRVYVECAVGRIYVECMVWRVYVVCVVWMVYMYVECVECMVWRVYVVCVVWMVYVECVCVVWRVYVVCVVWRVYVVCVVWRVYVWCGEGHVVEFVVHVWRCVVELCGVMWKVHNQGRIQVLYMHGNWGRGHRIRRY